MINLVSAFNLGDANIYVNTPNQYYNSGTIDFGTINITTLSSGSSTQNPFTYGSSNTGGDMTGTTYTKGYIDYVKWDRYYSATAADVTVNVYKNGDLIGTKTISSSASQPSVTLSPSDYTDFFNEGDTIRVTASDSRGISGTNTGYSDSYISMSSTSGGSRMFQFRYRFLDETELNTDIYYSLNGGSNNLICSTCNITPFNLTGILEGENNISFTADSTTTNFNFTIDQTNPTINNSLELELNKYSLDLNFSCNDLNLDSCIIEFQDESKNSTELNKIFSTNGNQSYTIIATDLAGNTINQTGNIFVNPFQYFYFQDEDSNLISNFTFNELEFENFAKIKLYDLGIGNHQVTFSKQGYQQSLVNLTFNTTTNYNKTYDVLSAKLIINLYDAVNQTLITSEEFSLSLKGEISYQATTTTGKYNISSILSQGEYEAIISSDLYETKNLYFTFNGQEVKKLDVYLIAIDSENLGYVFIQGYKADGSFLKFAKVYAKQWFSNTNSYETVQQSKTTDSGRAELKVLLEDYFYIFCIETDYGEKCTEEDQIIKSTDNGKVISLSEDIKINLENTFFDKINFVPNVVVFNQSEALKGLSVGSQWSSVDGFDVDLCFKLTKNYNFTKEVVQLDCVSSLSGNYDAIYLLNSTNEYIFEITTEVEGINTNLYRQTISAGDSLSDFLIEEELESIIVVVIIILGMFIIISFPDPALIAAIGILELIVVNFFFETLIGSEAASGIVVLSLITAWGLRKQ